MSPAPAAAPAAPAKNGKDDQAVQPRPFVAGSRPIDESKFDDSLTFSTSTQRFDSYGVSPQGFLGGIWLLVECVTAANIATVAFADDAPFNALDTVYFQDVGSQPLVGPLSGYDLYVINKYGGYHYLSDPKASGFYSVTAGAGGTGGSFSFILYLPVEIVHRDALGALPNTSGSAQFRLDVTLAATATVYDTAPTNAGSVRLRYELEGWQDPPPADIHGMPVAQNPPAAQTTQFWQKSTEDIASGSFDRKLVNFNGLLRNLIFVWRRAADGLRSSGDGDFPDPFTFQYEKNLLVDARIRGYWRHRVHTDYGLDNGTETAGGGSAATTARSRDLGVYPLSWCRDFGLQVGGELRLGYLEVSDATNLTIKGSAGAADTVHVLVNYVRYLGDPRALTMGR